MARAWLGRPARSVASPWSIVGAESGVFWAPSGDSSIRMQAKESRPLVIRVSTTVSRRSPAEFTEPGRAPTNSKGKTESTKSRYACAETFTGKENDRGGGGDRGIRRRVFDRNNLGYQPEGGRTPLAFCGASGKSCSISGLLFFIASHRIRKIALTMLWRATSNSRQTLSYLADAAWFASLRQKVR